MNKNIIFTVNPVTPIIRMRNHAGSWQPIVVVYSVHITQPVASETKPTPSVPMRLLC